MLINLRNIHFDILDRMNLHPYLLFPINILHLLNNESFDLTMLHRYIDSLRKRFSTGDYLRMYAILGNIPVYYHQCLF